MKKIKYTVIGLLPFAIMSFNVTKNDDSGELDVYVIEASAQSPGACAANGYKTWAGGLFGTKAKNCWCETVRKPRLVCETATPGNT